MVAVPLFPSFPPKLKKEIQHIGAKVKCLKPNFIKEVAESCEPVED